MSKIFNIYLNSTQKISGNNNNATYFIDWSSYLGLNIDVHLCVFGRYFRGNYKGKQKR